LAVVSVVGLCNGGLRKLGASRITALSDNSKNARLCNDAFEDVRDQVLAAHPWNFATDRVELGLLASTPLYGFSYQFQLPQDCLRVLQTEDNEGDVSQEFKVEGRVLLTNATSCKILYIKRIEDPSQYSPLFVEVFEFRLAAELSYAITQSSTVQQTMFAAYAGALKQARHGNAVEGVHQKVQDDGSWITVRR
jgi:hypothetical protein